MDNEFEFKTLRAMNDIRDSSDIILRYQQNCEEVLRTLAGPQLDEMRRDRRFAHNCLTSTIINLRVSAIFLMRDYWGADQDFSKVCMTLAFHDLSSTVRGVSLYALLRCYKHISDPVRLLLKYCFGSTGLCHIIGDVGQKNPIIETDEARTVGVGQLARLRFLTKMAGSHARDLLKSLDFAKTCLQSPDRNLRIAALVSIKDYHGAPKWFLRTCEEMLQDTDESVRNVATSMLGWLYEKTENARIAKLLAGYVCNETVTDNFRCTAYNALLRVQGIFAPWFEMRGAKDQPSLKNIDWSLVRRLLEQ